MLVVGSYHQQVAQGPVPACMGLAVELCRDISAPGLSPRAWERGATASSVIFQADTVSARRTMSVCPLLARLSGGTGVMSVMTAAAHGDGRISPERIICGAASFAVPGSAAMLRVAISRASPPN